MGGLVRAVFKGKGFTGSTLPEILTSKIFNTISALFSTLSVTILSRNIAFSFHLKRSVTLKSDEKAFAAEV